MKTLKKLSIILLTLSFIYLYCEEDINNILNNLFKESVSYKKVHSKVASFLIKLILFILRH